MPTEMNLKIPEITDVRLTALAERIKPVYTFKEKGLYYIKPVNLRNVAYTWDPQPAIKAVGLKKCHDLTTLHAFDYYAFFKPSVAEVLAQIPEEYLESVVAFEIVGGPVTADDLMREKEALRAGFHMATTRLYVKA